MACGQNKLSIANVINKFQTITWNCLHKEENCDKTVKVEDKNHFLTEIKN